MSKPDKEGTLSFIERCLTDAKTGKVMLSKRDQEFLHKAFKAIGRDVRRPFKDEGDLLHAFFRTLDAVDFLLFFEQFRLIVPDNDDPHDDLRICVDVSDSEYLAIRIIAKLSLLRADSEDLPTWIRGQFGEGYVNQDGRIAFEDEERMIEFDKVLEERVRTTLWAGNAGTT